MMGGIDMKKLVSFATIAAFALLAACNKQSIDIVTPEDTVPVQISFNLSATHPDGSLTKAVKTGWESGDVIFVFFSGVAAPKYLKMSFDGTSWTTTEMNGASAGSLGFSNGDSGTMRAIYLPFGSTATVSADGGAFKFSTTYYSYYLTATLPYTVSAGSISGTFDMQIPTGYVQFFIDKADADPSDVIELRNKNLTPQGIASVASDGTITHTASATGAPLPGYVYDKEVKAGGESKGYLFSGILAEGARNISTDYNFTLVAGGWDGSYYKKSYTGKTFYRGDSDGRAIKLPAIASWTPITEYKPIDLGIDVGGKRVYWADRNLGASSESGAGDYYAWGETTPYYTGDPQANPPAWKSGKEAGYVLASYSLYSSGYTKYISTTELETLELADDAANVLLGGDWRIPTLSEAMDGLKNQGNWVDEGVDGVSRGFRITSKRAGYSSSIFIPWQGYRSGTTINEVYVNGGGTLWLSTRWSSYVQYAHCLDFGLGGVDQGGDWRGDRGRAIRPVTD